MKCGYFEAIGVDRKRINWNIKRIEKLHYETTKKI